MGMRNQRGMTLIEVLIVSAIISFLAVTMGTMLTMQQNSLRNIENKSNFMTLSRDIDLVLQSQSMCISAFRQSANQPLVYSPPAGVNAPYSRAAPMIYAGTSSVIASVGVSQNNAGFNITRMQLQRVVGSPVENTNFTNPNNGTVTNVRRHLAELQIDAQRVGGTLAGQPLTKRSLIYLYVDSTNNQIVTCQQNSQVRLVRAMAIRSGLTAYGQSCLDVVSPNLYRANPGCDTNGDGFCESDSNLVAEPHPMYADGTATDADWAHRTTSVIGATGQEGRCPVIVLSNGSTELPANIFRIANADLTATPAGARLDGIGCSTLNGWYLSSCSTANNGIGDSDAAVKTDAMGEYCVTNDFVQPHYRRLNLVWGLIKTGVTVICTKFE